MKERDIQKEILLALTHEFHPHGIFWTADTGAARSMDGKRVIRFGCPGQPDVQGCLAGRWIGVEVKTLTGQQRDSQIRFQAAIEKAGGIYIVARSADAAIESLSALFPRK